MNKLFLKLFLYLLLTFVFTSNAFSQLELNNLQSAFNSSDNKFRKAKKFSYGGQIFFSVSNNQSFIDLSPIGGYFFNEYFMGYIKAKYIYTSLSHPSIQNFIIKEHIIGGGLGVNYFIKYTPLTATFEYEKVFVINSNNNRFNADILWLGGGFNVIVSEKILTRLSLLFKLNETVNNNIFRSPRVNFTISYLL